VIDAMHEKYYSTDYQIEAKMIQSVMEVKIWLKAFVKVTHDCYS
jgi:hypothetical protein